MRNLYMLLALLFSCATFFYTNVTAQTTQNLHQPVKTTNGKQTLPVQEAVLTGQAEQQVSQLQINIDPNNPPKRFSQDMPIPDFKKDKQLHPSTPATNSANPQKR